MSEVVRRIFKDARGATAIEYAMIAGGISIAIIGAVNAIGVSIVGMFDTIAALF